MGCYCDDCTDMGEFHRFWDYQAAWSEETFGLDSERGPKGPLKHLAKEVQEALDDIEAGKDPKAEIVDCLFLTIDAARRAGFKCPGFIYAAFDKLEINRARQWQKPTSDEPVEHIRE